MSDVQFAKAFSPSDCNVLGSVTLVSVVQLQKAPTPMVFMLSGMTRSVKDEQPKNALSLIAVTALPFLVEGIVEIEVAS